MKNIHFLSFTIILTILLLIIIDSSQSSINLSYSASGSKELFINNCSKCHRRDGSGIKGVYPPLKNSDYIPKNTTSELLRGMLFGRSGRLSVNGTNYNGVMTTEIDNSLSDDDIASILNYVYKDLNSMDRIATVKDVKAARAAGKLPVHK
jgi:nitrite reductase (NO-forming)